MDKRLKKTLKFLSLILLIMIGGYSVMKIFSKAFGAKCEKIETTEIGEYKLTKSKCLGWAGPYYYPVDVYKSGKLISASFIQEDSCKQYYSSGKEKILVFDFCNDKIIEKLPIKDSILVLNVDSIRIIKMSSLNDRKLTQEEIIDFSNRWNSAIPDGATKMNMEYYPEPKYLIEIFEKNKIRKFKTSHMSIQEKDDFWSYSFLEKNEPRTTQKFDDIFKIQ